MAMVSPKVLADVVEANEFPEVSERYRVMAVPKTVINDRAMFTGAQPEERFLAEIKRILERSEPAEAP